MSVGSAECWLVSDCSGWDDDWGRLSSASVSHLPAVSSGCIPEEWRRSKRETHPNVHVIFMPLLTPCLLMSQWPKHVTWRSPDSREVKHWVHQCHQSATSGSTLFLHLPFVLYMDSTLQFRECKVGGLSSPNSLLLASGTSSYTLFSSLLKYTIQHETRIYLP